VLFVLVAIGAAALVFGQIRSSSRDVLSRTKIPTPMELLTARVDNLEKENAKLKADLKAFRDEFAKFTGDTRLALLPPEGYSSMVVTKSNFNNIDGKALMKFWVRH
jgi:hypothetical protein